MSSNTEKRTVQIIIDGTQAATTQKQMISDQRILKGAFEASGDALERAKIAQKYQEIGVKVTELKTQLYGIKQAQSEVNDKLDGAAGAWGRIKEIALGFLTGEAIEKGFEKLVEFGEKVIEIFAESEIGARKLSSALQAMGGTKDELGELNAQSEHLTKTGIFSKDAISDIQVMLLQFRLTATQVQQLTPLVANFAASTGQNIDAAANIVMRAAEGQTKALAQYGIVMQDTGSKSKNLAEITRQLEKRFSDMDGTIASTTTGGALAQMKNTWEEIEVTLGGFAAKAITPALKAINEFAHGVQESFHNIHEESEALEEQRVGLLSLVHAIQDTNEKSEVRKSLMADLQKEYPDFLGNLNAEKVTNEELGKRLEEVNAQYLKRIVLESNKEDIEAASKKITAAYKEQGIAIKELEALNTKYHQSIKDASKGGKEQIEDVFGFNTQGQALDIKMDFIKVIDKQTEAIKKQVDAEKELKDAHELNDKILKISGVQKMLDEEAAANAKKLAAEAANASGDDVTKKGLADIEKEKERKKKAYEKLLQLREKFNQDVITLEQSLQNSMAQAEQDEFKRELNNLEAKNKKQKDDADKIVSEARVRLKNAVTERFMTQKEADEELLTLQHKNAAAKLAIDKQSIRERGEIEYKQALRDLEKYYTDERVLIAQEEADGIITHGQSVDKIHELDKKYLTQKINLQKDYGKDSTKEEKALADEKIKIQNEEWNKEKDRILKAAEFRVKYAKKGTDEELQAKIDLIHAQTDIELQNTEYTEQQKQQIIAASEEAIDNLRMEHLKGQFQKVMKFVDELKKGVDAYYKYLDTKENAQLAIDKKNTDIAIRNDNAETKKAKDNIEDLLDERNMSARRAEKEKKKIDDESAKRQKKLQDDIDAKDKQVKHDQAVRAHELAIFDTTIAGAKAVVEALPNIPLSIAVGAIAATELGFIIGEGVPENAAGGPPVGAKMPVRGQQSGKIHNTTWEGIARGGYYSTPTLFIAGEAPGQTEYIIPGTMMRNPAIANIAGMLESIRVGKEFAAGGFVSNSTASLVPVNNNSNTTNDIREQQMIEALNQNAMIMLTLKQRLDDPVPSRSFIVYQDQQNADNTINNIKLSAQGGR